MARILVAFICLVVAISARPNNETKRLKADVVLVENIQEYMRANPQVQLTPLQKSIVNLRGTIVYTLGNRVSGDVLVAQGGESFSYPSLQNVQLALSYPPNGGLGATVNYVQVDVSQSSNLGSGYVTSGGIGQRSIAILIEAQSTSYFQYSAQIYGY